MKKYLKRLFPFVFALIISSGLFFASQSFVFAEDLSEEPAAAEELFDTSSEESTENLPEEPEHDSFSEEMLSEAIELYSAEPAPLLGNSPEGNARDPHKIIEGASLPYTGTGNILAFHINFPNDDDPGHQTFEEGDTVEALQNAIGISTDNTNYSSDDFAQYNNLHDYYQRASYGKLFLYGDVYSYSALKDREDYTDHEELLKEVMDFFNEQIDYSKYDADGDKEIDCVYLHVPYDGLDEWSTKWWPACHVASDSIFYDNVAVASNIVISRHMNKESGRRTLIHETGHAMGFPDYYSYNTAQNPSAVGPNGLSGIMTYDMMNDDIGDHNGFSKWIAGWLTEDDIIRVQADENGVVAKKNGVPVGTLDSDGSLTLDLSAFDTDTVSETGGIIVIDNSGQAPFSSYYMIQYDSYAGNQKISYGFDDGLPLTSGFRVFRVQAELTDYNTLLHNNTDDPLYNRLIEVVDHDITSYHSSRDGRISSAYAEDSLGCLFYAGDSLTPKSTPSTNFQENIDVGFTGLTINFLESNESHGKLKISYSDEYKPMEKPFEIELSSAEAFPGGCRIEFTANQQLSTANPYAMYARIAGEGNIFYLRNTTISGNVFSGDLFLDTDMLSGGRELTYIFQEGAFTTSTGDSPKITLTVPVSKELIGLSESDSIADTRATYNNAHICSPIFRNEDGSFYFYEYSNTYRITSITEIHKYTFNQSSPKDALTETIDLESEEGKTARKIFDSLFSRTETENASIVSANADLGSYPLIFDAVKIGENYYVLSFDRAASFMNPERTLAITKLDADGHQIKQILPQVPTVTRYDTPMQLQLQPGPNNHFAVEIFAPALMKDYQDDSLNSHSITLFYDTELEFEGRLDNNTTGCGTWLDDGRYISFTQRMQLTADGSEYRTELLSYDITTVIDSPYVFENEELREEPEWTIGSSDALLFTVHRVNDDENAFSHFIGVKVDDKELTKNDYTAEPGSVKITLKPAFLKTLSEGEHTLTALFVDGSASTTFKVLKNSSGQSSGQSPSTGDQNHLLIWIILMLAAVIVAVSAVLIIKRNPWKK